MADKDSFQREFAENLPAEINQIINLAVRKDWISFLHFEFIFEFKSTKFVFFTENQQKN